MKILRIIFATAILASIAFSQLAMTGNFLGTPLDYVSAHGGTSIAQTGDTQYCVQSAATFANGASAGTTVLNRGDGNGNVSLSGQIICTWNDGTAPGGIGRDLGLYKMTTLDMTSAANTTQVIVNTMDDYGTSGSPNAPAGWHGKGTSADTTRIDANWKTEKIASWGGWIILPLIRQNVGALFEGSDSTLLASPDGGIHWCNPNTFFAHSGSPGCDSGNWSATGDAPKCDAASSATACLNSAYLDGTHSSIMWHDQAPYDGTTNRMGRLFFIDYCQDNSCTGMPDGADTYLYVYGETGKYGATILGRVQKNILKIMDPAQWEWYSQANYAPNNVGNGTSWTSTLASASNLFVGAQVVGLGITAAQGYTDLKGTYLNPIYVCSNGGCGYTMVTGLQYLTNTPITIGMVSYAAPWGPFTVRSMFNQSAAYIGFPNLLRWTAWSPDSRAYHARVGIAFVNNSVASAESSLFLQQVDLNVSPPQVGAELRGNSQTRFCYDVVVNCIVSKGLRYYFGFLDNNAYTTWPLMGALDQVHPDGGTQPAAQFIGCYTDGGAFCGIVAPTKGISWDAFGTAISGGPGYAARMELRDLALNTGSGANYYGPQTDTTFTNNGGDTDFTISMMYNSTDVTTTQALFNAGPAEAQTYILLYGPTPGSLSLDWQPSSGVFIGAATANGTIVNNTWYNIVAVYRAGGQLNSGNVSSRVKLYVNGVSIPVSYTGSPGTPNIGAGSITAGYTQYTPGGSSFSAQGTISGLGWYNRAISPAEVTNNYGALRTVMKRRGINLP